MKNKRIFLLVPEALEFDMLTEDQATAIQMVLGEPQIPMGGTRPYEGYKVVQALISDGFDPDEMINYSIDWEILGLWSWTEQTLDGEITEIIPIDRVRWLEQFQADDYIEDGVDENGYTKFIAVRPTEFKITANYGGLPRL